MANIQFQNGTFFKRKVAGKIQTAENIRISVKTDIAEVLSVGVENCVHSYEATEGEVTFFGKTAIKFLYNDGTGIASSNYNADFTAALQNDEITADTKMSFDVVTMDSKVDVNANTATLTVLLEITAYSYVCQSIPYFAEGEDVFVRKESLEVLQNANVLRLPTVIDEELAASKTISTVLLAESTLCIGDYTNADGILRVTGEATVRLTYISEGTIVTDVLPFKFDRELDAADIPQGAQLKIAANVRGTKVRLSIAEDSINTDFTVEISAVLCVECAVTGALDIVCDAYGAECDFAFQRQTVITTLPCGSTVAQKQATGTLPFDTGKTFLTAVNCGAIVTKCTSLAKCAQVEGVIYATALYSEENRIDSVQLELPFIQTVEIDYLAPQCISTANVVVTNLNVIQSSTLNVTADLFVAVDSFKDVTCQLIVAADEKPFDKTQLPAIEVCLAHKGETLWELAKGLHLSEEDLLAVNPEISSPLDKDARIVVYNKI